MESLQEFEAGGARRVTTTATNLKLGPTSNYINSNLYIIDFSRRKDMLIFSHKNYTRCPTFNNRNCKTCKRAKKLQHTPERKKEIIIKTRLRYDTDGEIFREEI